MKRRRISTAVLIGLLTVFLPQRAAAQDRGDTPMKYDVSVGGAYMAGNLHQAELYSSLRVSRSTKTSGFDLIGSIFQFWSALEAGGALTRLSNEQSLMALPFYYLADRPYLLGVARVERSGLNSIDSRLNAGAGLGIAPVRETNQLLRVAVGGQVERTQYSTDTLTPDWANGINPRVVPRVFVVSNGWLSIPNSPISGFFVGSFLMNPSDFRDVRGHLDSGLDVQISRAMSLRLGLDLTHQSVVPAGRLNTDLRSTVGLSWKTPPKSDA